MLAGIPQINLMLISSRVQFRFLTVFSK